jgi:hypothetical protein
MRRRTRARFVRTTVMVVGLLDVVALVLSTVPDVG